MPGTKISCNSFYMYMLAVKEREESKGKRFPRGLDDVVPLASFEWYHLSPELKTIYKEKAREYKNSAEFRTKKRLIRNQPRRIKGKQKHDGTSSEESFIDDEEVVFYDPEDEEKFYRRRERDRNNLKTALTWNLGSDYLAKKVTMESFFVISIQNYFETVSHEYMPAEISMVEFSLARGIISQYTVIVKPMFIPEHCRMLSSRKANETHQISPECPPTESRDDYRNVIEEMKNFYIHKQSNQFRVFVLTKQFNSVQGGIKVLRDKTGSKYFLPAEKVSNVEDLFVLLRAFKGVNPKRTDLMGFDELLLETNWDFEPHTLCTYHNRQQSKYCTLATARKVCYYLFERLKDVYDLNLTSNHIPPLPMKSKFRYPINNGNSNPADCDNRWSMDDQQNQIGNQKLRPMPLMKSDDVEPYFSNNNKNWCDWDQERICRPQYPYCYENYSTYRDDIPLKYMNQEKHEMCHSENQQQYTSGYGSNVCNAKHWKEDDYWCRPANSRAKQCSNTVAENSVSVAQNDLQNCTRLNNVNASDYFTLHSIRPPFARPNVFPNSKPSFNENASTFDPLLDEKQWMQNIPNLIGSVQKSHLLRTPVHNFSSLMSPVYHDKCSIENSENVRRPNTTSLCAQLMEENRVRLMKPGDC